MAKKIESTLPLVLESAKEEFLEKGFEKASMRSIAQNAGVTTGALYVRFSSKDALFEELVSPIAATLFGAFSQGTEQGKEAMRDGSADRIWKISEGVIGSLIDYFYANRDLVLLLLNCAGGSSQEGFLESVVDEEVRQAFDYVDAIRAKGLSVPAVDKDQLHVLLGAQMHAVAEVLRRESDREKAQTRIRDIARFFEFGWRELFET